MSAHAHPRITPEEYLAIERAAEFRSEYYNGEMFAMSGGSFPHVSIIGNLAAELRGALKGRGCVVGSSDLRVRVSPEGLYTYPDVVVVCGDPKFADDQKDTLLNPMLLAEVLSPSTEGHDRGFKSTQYRQIESLQVYALVSQTEPRIEVYNRQSAGDWLLSEFAGLDRQCRFRALECEIPLSEIYLQVKFAAPDDPRDVSPRKESK
jgi:Uma2 family endonuclease